MLELLLITFLAQAASAPPPVEKTVKPGIPLQLDAGVTVKWLMQPAPQTRNAENTVVPAREVAAGPFEHKVVEGQPVVITLIWKWPKDQDRTLLDFADFQEQYSHTLLTIGGKRFAPQALATDHPSPARLPYRWTGVEDLAWMSYNKGRYWTYGGPAGETAHFLFDVPEGTTGARSFQSEFTVSQPGAPQAIHAYTLHCDLPEAKR